MDAILPFLSKRPSRQRASDQVTTRMIDNQMWIEREVCDVVGDAIIVWGTMEVCEGPLMLQE